MSQSFTMDCGLNARVLISEIGISFPFNDNSGIELSSLETIRTTAIWDTGATGTVITKELAQKLNLKPIGRTMVQGVNSKNEVNEYLVSVWLPNSVVIPSVRITECTGLNGQQDVLVGMDIISLGDFSVSKNGSSLIFSFRMPSQEAIDYTGKMPKIKTKRPANLPKLPPPEKKHFSRSERRKTGKK